MALTITTLTVLNEYINGVMSRADHHALNVNEIVLTLAGAVIWRSTDDIRVRTKNTKTANVLWMTINNKTYVLAYNHNTGDIEIRDKNQNGKVLATFNNSSTITQVKTVFLGL